MARLPGRGLRLADHHEPSANLHGAPTALGHGVLVLGSAGFLADHAPDLVLTVGLFGLSRPTMELIRAAGRHVAIELPTVGREVCDPLRTAERVLTGIPLPPEAFTPDPAWLAAWQAADPGAAGVVTDELADAGALTGSAVAARVWTRRLTMRCSSSLRPGRYARWRCSPAGGPGCA